jgi:hypothetical protein
MYDRGDRDVYPARRDGRAVLYPQSLCHLVRAQCHCHGRSIQRQAGEGPNMSSLLTADRLVSFGARG